MRQTLAIERSRGIGATEKGAHACRQLRQQQVLVKKLHLREEGGREGGRDECYYCISLYFSPCFPPFLPPSLPIYLSFRGVYIDIYVGRR
jgi:hypothetical protein